MKATQAIPTIDIQQSGRSLPPRYLACLEHITVSQGLSVPAQCELIFRGSTAGEMDWKAGDDLTVSAAEFSQPFFDGDVTAVEYRFGTSTERELRIVGYDKLHRLRKRESVRAFVEVSLADLAREIAGAAGLGVTAERAGPFWRRIFQHDQDDLEFLSTAAARSGFYLILDGHTLRLVDLSGIGNPIRLTLGEDLLEAQAEVNSDRACRSVRVMGWSAVAAEAVAGVSSSPRVGRRVQAEAPPSRFGGPTERVLAGEPVADGRDADGVAQAELDERTASEVVLRGLADGSPELRPGRRVDVHGLSSSLDGAYVLTATVHEVDRLRGYVTEISTEPPALVSRVRNTVMALGRVVRVDDPDGLGRVRLTLPAYADVETEWLGVVFPAGGGRKGLVALPSVDDTVLVLMPDHDPSQGVVVGGLYGTSGAPDAGVEAGSVKRYTLLSPGGHRITLDDNKQSVRLEDSQGNYLDMGKEGVHLFSKLDLRIEAPGKRVVIAGENIDFRRI